MQRINARLAYYIFSATISLAQAIMFTTYAVYYIQMIGMNPLQLVLVGTVLELTILLCEVPTGVVADTYSRRLSLIIGVFILGIAWTIEGALPLYAAIIVAEIIRGVGETFLSGATDAWLADEVGETNVGPIYVRSGQISRIVGLVGVGIGVGLATIALNLPMLVGGGLLLLLGVFLALFMPEAGFTRVPRSERANWHSLAHTFRSGARVVRRSQTLTLLMIVGVLAGIASEGWDRLWEAHLLTTIGFPALGNLEPVVWFGIIAVLGEIVGLVAVALFQRRLERASQSQSGTARALLVLNALSIGGVIVFALAGNFWLAIAALLVRGVVRGFIHPLYNAWLIQNIDPRVRATALSMISQTDALGQTLGGPGIGWIGVYSLRAALVAAGALLTPMVLLYARVLRHNRVATSDPALTTAAIE
jgi:MFS family permease